MTSTNTIGQGTLTLADPADLHAVVGTAIGTITLTPSITPSGATFTITAYQGTLPAGLTLAMAGDNLSATITGTPTATASSTVLFLVVASSGERFVTDGALFESVAVLAIGGGLSSPTTIEATKSTAWSYQLFNSGGRANFTWTKATGTYPAGLSLSTAGVISGTPTATGSQVLTFTVTDANSNTATTANVTITVNDVLALSADSITWTAGNSEENTIVATGGTLPIFFTTDIDPPDGLATYQTARTFVIAGIVESGASNDNITVTATDANGDTGTGLLTITISI